MNGTQNTTAKQFEFAEIPFVKRLKSMLKLDFYRLFHTPLFYIMILIAALIPALVLGTAGMESTVDGVAQSGLAFTNTWKVFESISGETAGFMDFANMANVNMVFIFAALMMSIFIAHDYGSGFVKNIFAVHSKKHDYILSKSIVGVFGGACMIVAYLLVTIAAGALMGKSFDLGTAGVGGLIMCLLSKIALMGVFIPLYLSIAVLFKQKLWLTIVATFAAGIIFYPIASIAVPLNSNILTFIMCIAAAGIAFMGFGSLSGLILNKRDLT